MYQKIGIIENVIFQFVVSIGKVKSARTMYTELNERIERMTRTLYLIVVKVAWTVTIVPPLITSLVHFYVSDLGTESFELLCPTMYG